MAHNETFQATIELNSEKAQSRLKALEKELADARKKQKDLYAEGTKESKKMAQEMDKDIKRITRDLREETRHVNGLNAALKSVSSQTYKDLQKEVKALRKLMRDGTVQKKSDEWYALANRIKECKREMREYEAATQEMQKQNIFKKFIVGLNTHWGAITQILGAITGLTVAIRSSVKAFAEMEEAMADTRKYTGLTDEAIRDLNEDLKKMDTRTSREELNELAGAAGRLGKTAKQDILDFVEAGNMIKVALGDDLGDGAIDKVGKLAMAFGEDKTKGLRGAMLATGSAVNELAQNSSAQAGYLVDFTARVAGFGKQLGLTQAQIMGFGAVMDENLLRDEMAATAFGNMLTKMQTDTEKFARIAGMEMADFAKLLKEDANGAILALADNLKKADPQSMMKMLDDMGLDGSRAVGVLATLADKIDDVRARQELATKAYQEATSIEKEYNTMNNTVEAGLEKAKKQFHEISVELGERLMPIVKYTISGTSMMIRLLSQLITFVNNYKATLILLTTTMGMLVLKKQADVLITKAEIFWNEKLIVTCKRLWATLMANPFALVAGAITLVLGLIIDLTSRTDKLAKSEDNLTRIRNNAKKSIIEEKDKVEQLIKASKDETLSLDDRKKAISALNEVTPGYIQDLDKETGKYRENKKALEDYLNSLTRKYEIEGAKDLLASLGKEIADLTVKAEKGREAVEGAQRLTNSRQGYARYNQSETMFVVANEQHAVAELAKTNKQLQDKKDEHDRILNAFGRDIYKNEAGGTTNTSGGGTTTYKSAAQQKKEEQERNKQEAAARKAQAERLHQLREADKAQKAITDNRLAENMLAYRTGEQNYRQFLMNQKKIQEEGLQARMNVWDRESAEYAKLQKELADLQLNGDQQLVKLRLSDIDREHAMVKAKLQASYNDENSTYYMDRQALEEALYQADIIYLEKKKNLYRQGSQERIQIEDDIERQEYEHQKQQEITYQQMLNDLKATYLQQGDKERETMELNNLDTLHKAGLLKEEEYQQALLAIRAHYAQGMTPDEKTQQTAGNMLQVASSAAANGAGSGTGIPFIGTIQQYTATMEKLKELYGQDEANHQAYLQAKQQATSQFLSNMSQQFASAYQGVEQVMSAASNFYGAQADYEVAVTKKKYEKQIAAAGNNQKRVKALQDKQAKEEAAIKTKYNRKQVKIQIAQAIAQTAMGAINAYSSAAAVPVIGYILAPIAAAMAVAAGMLQVAAIKKQAAAQEAGYYEGGFTGGSSYRKEAGVVHEGEFVANHAAVNNPNVLPLLEFLDAAQRNNTVGSLTRDDIQRQLGEGGGGVVTPIVNVNTDNPEMQGAVEKLNASTDKLNEQLSAGIPAYVVIDGPTGFHRQYKHYLKLNKE